MRSYSKQTRIPTTHYRKERPASLISDGVLTTEDGNTITTEDGAALVFAANRADWLPTVNAVKDDLRIAAGDTSEDAHIDELIDEALAIVKRECGIDTEATNYVAVIDADDYEFERVKIDRNEVIEVSSVEALEDEGSTTPLDFEVRWQNGMAYIVLQGRAMFPANRDIQIEYSRGLSATADIAKLFYAAVKHTAKSLYDDPGRVADKTMPRAPIYNALHNALRDRRSVAKWTK